MVENFATVLAPEAVPAKICAQAELIAPAATRVMRQEEYAAAVQTLVDFVALRAEDVEVFLTREE